MYLLCYSPGLPLYCDKSEVTGGKKFGEVMQEVLLPMTLDYYVRSRDVDVDALAFDQLSNLNGDVAQKKAAIKVWLIAFLTLYSPVAVCVFSILFSVHFSWYWQENLYINQELFSVGDHFLYSHDPYVLFSNDTVRRSLILVKAQVSQFFRYNLKKQIRVLFLCSPSLIQTHERLEEFLIAMETLNCISGQCVDQFEASTSPWGKPPRHLNLWKLVRSKTHLPPTRGQNFVQMPHLSVGFDHQLFNKRQDLWPWLSCRTFLLSHLLTKVNFCLINTSILNDKTRFLCWKDSTVPVQIPHSTQAKFKLPTPEHKRQSSARWLPGGC